MCGGSWRGGVAQESLTTLIFLVCPLHDRKRGNYFLSSANENMDLIHREMDWGMGCKRPLGFHMSVFSILALREKLSVVTCWNIRRTSCVWCVLIKAASVLGNSEPRTEDRNKSKEGEHWVTLQVKLWVIVFLDKEAKRIELCVSVSVLQMLTSHKAIKEVLMRPKSDLF